MLWTFLSLRKRHSLLEWYDYSIWLPGMILIPASICRSWSRGPHLWQYSHPPTWYQQPLILDSRDTLNCMLLEIGLVWPAPSSYVKHIFLFKRYLVPASLLTIAWGISVNSCNYNALNNPHWDEMNHFSGLTSLNEVGIVASVLCRLILNVRGRCKMSLLLCSHTADESDVNSRCRDLFFVIAMLSIISLGMAIILFLLWVVNLWDRGR
jgi:hypothetical protein